MTWKEIKATLPPSLCGEALELLRRHTAPARHAARLKAAIDAASLEATRIANSETNHFEIWEVAAILSEIEVTGHGGEMHLGGESRASARAKWAANLGKGRAQATDGAAWTAAIAAAAREMWTYVPEDVRYSDRPHRDRQILMLIARHGGDPILRAEVVTTIRRAIIRAFDEQQQELAEWSELLRGVTQLEEL